jgi:hypothetical protein
MMAALGTLVFMQPGGHYDDADGPDFYATVQEHFEKFDKNHYGVLSTEESLKLFGNGGCKGRTAAAIALFKNNRIRMIWSRRQLISPLRKQMFHLALSSTTTTDTTKIGAKT